MDQIRFKSGEFQDFVATRTFELGTFGVKVIKGSELTFDGSTVNYGGASYMFPQFRGASNAGWVVPTAEYEEGNPLYGAPASANIKMRPPTDAQGQAKTAVATIEADERTVMSSATHAAATRDTNRGKSMKTAQQGGAESQEGVEVGRVFKTAAKTRSSLSAESAGEALRQANNVQIEAGQGITEEQMLARMAPEDRAVYLAKKDSLKSRYVDTDISSQGTQVATIKSASKVKEAEGMKLTQTVGGGVEIADMGGTGGKAEASTRTEDGITFKNTNGPKNKPQVHPRTAAETPVMHLDGTADIRRKIAHTMCPDFPASYDFTASPKKKLARLQADFEDRPDVLRAVFAIESDAFKQQLVAEFPQAFQG
jgi:hypothetical protein